MGKSISSAWRKSLNSEWPRVGDRASQRLLTAARRRRAEIRPLNRAVRDAPARIGVRLDVDELVGGAAILGAAAAAIAVAARVEHRDDDGFRAFAEAQIVKFQRVEVGEGGHDVVLGDPGFG